MDNLSNYNSTVISFSLVQNLQHNTSSQQAPQMQEQNKLEIIILNILDATAAMLLQVIMFQESWNRVACY